MHTIQKAVCPTLRIPILHGLFGVSPFSVRSGHGNSQKSGGSGAWHWSTTWSHFSRRNNCKGNHPSLPKRRTTGRNPHSWDTSRGQNMPDGEGRELMLKSHQHCPWTNLHWLWPSSTMTTVTTWECRVRLPSDPSPFLTQKGKKKRHDKIHTKATRGIIKLSYSSGFQAAVLRTWGVSMDYCWHPWKMTN